MGGNPRENAKNKGFWDGGSKHHGRYGESAGKTSGVPGPRRPTQTGVRLKLETPERVSGAETAVDERGETKAEPESDRPTSESLPT